VNRIAIGLPPLLWLALLVLLPLGVVWAYSFGQNITLIDIAITGTLDNYARALKPLYLAIFARSAGIAALVTLACLVIGFPVALGIAFASPRKRAWLLLLVMLPFWTNLLIRTYALMAVLRPFGLLHSDTAVVIGLVYVHLPFMVLPLWAALDRLDLSLIEASRDLGAGAWTTLSRIILPLAAPGIAAGLVITFIPALGAYLTPDLLGGTSSQMIANVIERQFRSANDWPFGAALSFLLIYLTVALMLLRARFSREAA
jgi:spermidine/putrescine transport system permease protein